MLLLEYLLKNGHESFRNDTRQMLGQLQSLTYLQRYESGENHALEAVIRKKSGDIIQLCNDNDIYKMEREKAKKLRQTITTVSNTRVGGSQRTYNDLQDDSFSRPSYRDEYSLPSRSERKKDSSEDDLGFDPRGNQPSPAPSQPVNNFNPFGPSSSDQPNQQFPQVPSQPFNPYVSTQQPPQQPPQQSYQRPAASSISPPPSNIYSSSSRTVPQNYPQTNQNFEQPQQNYQQSQPNYQRAQQNYQQPPQNIQQPPQNYRTNPQNFQQAPQNFQQPQQSYQQPPNSSGVSGLDDLFGGPIKSSSSPSPNLIDFGPPVQAIPPKASQPAQFDNFSNSGNPQNSAPKPATPAKTNMFGDFGDLADFDLKGTQSRGYGKATAPRGSAQPIKTGYQ